MSKTKLAYELSKRKPEILLGLGIGGFIFSGILAVKQTPKAIVLLGRKKEELGLEDDEKMPVKEVVKTTWKLYLPSVLISATSAGCVIGAQKICNKRVAAMASVASLAESALIEYKDKVIETIGEKKEEKIADAVVQEKVNKNPPTEQTIIITGKGDVLCMDSLSNQYFRSNREKIQKAVNELNFKLRNEMYISLTDLYFELGIPRTDISDFLTWHIDEGYIEIRYIAALDDNGEPCLVLHFDNLPKYH